MSTSYSIMGSEIESVGEFDSSGVRNDMRDDNPMLVSAQIEANTGSPRTRSITGDGKMADPVSRTSTHWFANE